MAGILPRHFLSPSPFSNGNPFSAHWFFIKPNDSPPDAMDRAILIRAPGADKTGYLHFYGFAATIFLTPST
jgi:hypothetical protein